MNLIRLRIRKKTLVPTKHAIRHQWRSDWKLIYIITHENSYRLFKRLNGSVGITYDCEFAKMLRDNFGEGEYSVLAWEKGKSARFWSFYHCICEKDGFFRVNRKYKHSDLKYSSQDFKQIKKEFIETYNPELIPKLEELKPFHELYTHERRKRYGPSPYLDLISELNYLTSYRVDENIRKES